MPQLLAGALTPMAHGICYIPGHMCASYEKLRPCGISHRCHGQRESRDPSVPSSLETGVAPASPQRRTAPRRCHPRLARGWAAAWRQDPRRRVELEGLELHELELLVLHLLLAVSPQAILPYCLRAWCTTSVSNVRARRSANPAADGPAAQTVEELEQVVLVEAPEKASDALNASAKSFAT